MGEQLSLGEGRIIKEFCRTDARQQTGLVMPQVIQKGMQQAGFPMAMAQEQGPIGRFQGECQAAQIIMINRSTLTGHITFMPMAEVLIAPP